MVGFIVLGLKFYLFTIVSKNLKPISTPGCDAPKYPFFDTVALRSNIKELERVVTWRLKNVFTDNKNTKLTDKKQVLISLISSIKPF
ncbi:hypothetical protein QFZ20_000663 [Flavobacterium sp. W4I14]|nr:hypothetical protein [Flavobacterium sp. W4I14]